MDKKELQEQRRQAINLNKKIEDIQRKHREMHPDDWMPAYRPYSKSKEGIESMPTYYHTGDLGKYLKTYRTAKAFGAPDIPAEKLAAMALVEGRHDLGYNDWNKNNPRAAKLYENLVKGGATPEAAGFSAAVLDKHETAQRLKIPFENAWNGTGRSIWNKTGKDYSSKVKEAEKVLEHPKNKPLYDFIKGKVAAEDDSAERPVLAAAPDAVDMPQEYTEGNWRLI